MSARLTRAWVAALVVALLGVVGLHAPANAEQKKLKLATTASGPFGDHLATPLFSGTYVPGSVTSSFYVKNSSAQTARATISLVEKTPVNGFERALSFSASVDGSYGSPVPLFEDKKKNQCRTIVTGPTMAGGAVQRIDVSMHVADTAPMNQQARFAFVVTLSQVTTKGKVDVCGPQSPGDSTRVAGAGSAAQEPVVPPAPSGRTLPNVVGASLALVAAGGGLFLVALRRRRRETETP